MELGPRQKQWIKWIRENESKYKCVNELGTFDSARKELSECCILGSLLYKENKYKVAKIINNNLTDISGSTCFLTETYNELGLYDKGGLFKDNQLEYYVNGKTVVAHSLSEANDKLIPWSVIADFIEENPQSVFNKSY